MIGRIARVLSTWAVLLVVAVAVAWWWSPSWAWSDGHGVWRRPLSFLVASLFTAIGLRFLALGLTHVVDWLSPPSLDAVRQADPRAIVLYLRAFKDEESWFAHGADGTGQTLEEFLGPTIGEKLGPLVALGSPMDRLPPMGATRIYCTDADWHETAAKLMSEASCVLLLHASTENLTWELSHLIAAGMTHKLHILLPPEPPAGQNPYTEPIEASRSKVRPIRATLSALRYVLTHSDQDNNVIATLSAVAPPLAYKTLAAPAPDSLAASLRSAGLIPLSIPAGPGSVIAFQDSNATLVASGLSSAAEYAEAICTHLREVSNVAVDGTPTLPNGEAIASS